MDERDLTDGERALLLHLTSVDWPDAPRLHESVAHLKVTDTCGCGCASVSLRDARYPAQKHELEHWCNAVSADGEGAVMLWLGSEGRIASLDVERPEGGGLPDPATLVVTRPSETSEEFR